MTGNQISFRPETAGWAEKIPPTYMQYATEALDQILKRDDAREASMVIGAWHKEGFKSAIKLLVLQWAEGEQAKVNMNLFDSKNT